MPSPRALLLDALGTLLELRPPAPALCAQLRGRFGVELTEAEVARALAAEIAYYRAHLQEGRDARSLQSLRRRCAEVLRAALPDPGALTHLDTPALTDALLAALHFSPFPDAVPALEDARARGRRLIVVSNWDVSLHDVLARAGLTPLLDGVLTSAEVGARKPSAVIFGRALELAGCPPERALHVGDSLVEDVAGALATGIAAVLVRRDGAVPVLPGVATIATLAELGGLLDV